MPEAMAGVTPPPPETVKRLRVADVSAERSREISSEDLSEECALAEDGGVAAAVRFPAVSSKSSTSGNAVRRTIDLSERLTVTLQQTRIPDSR